MSKYWENRAKWRNRQDEKSFNRAWHRKTHRLQMIKESNRWGECKCGHKHFPCADPICNEMLCGGRCRFRGCKCTRWEEN